MLISDAEVLASLSSDGTTRNGEFVCSDRYEVMHAAGDSPCILPVRVRPAFLHVTTAPGGLDLCQSPRVMPVLAACGSAREAGVVQGRANRPWIDVSQSMQLARNLHRLYIERREASYACQEFKVGEPGANENGGSQ